MKYLKYIFLVLFLVIILPGLIYLGLAIYYQDSFMYGTWINGIYCTGKTIEEAAQELEKQFDYNEILVKTPAGDEKLILSDIDADVDFITALETYRRRQNPYVWYTGIFKKTGERKVHPQVNYSSEKLKEWLFNIKSYKDTINVGNDILSIKLTEEGYRLKEEKTLILNPDAALEVLEKAIFSGKKEAVLSEELCFFYREETLDMKNLREKFAKVEAFQNLDFTYHIKETKRKLSACELAEFLQVDENKVPSLGKSGELLFDEKRVEDFIEKLAKESDTWNNHYFETHDGEVVHIKKGNYGTRISKEKEKAFLKKWLSAPENTVHTPVYLTDVTYKDKNKSGQAVILEECPHQT